MCRSVEEYNARAVEQFSARAASRLWLGLAASMLLAGLPLLGCGGDSGSSQRPELTCGAQVPVVTANDVESQVMTPVCSSCHAPGGGGPGIGAPGQWETVDKMFNNTVGKPSTYSGLPIVDPGNLGDSVMYLKVLGGTPSFSGPRGESVGGVMPQPPTPMLTSSQITLLKNWICGGARR